MPYTHLTREERHTISALHRKGHKSPYIAEVLSRHPSTVRRELKRNRHATGSYSHIEAQKSAQDRSDKATCRAKRTCSVSWGHVHQWLRNEQWSPDQISAELTKIGLQPISHETIYLHIYQDQKQGGDLHTHLRHTRRKRKKRLRKTDQRGIIPDTVSIEERPEEVNTRSRFGDWEMDTIIGSPSGHVLVTMVERLSRYTIIIKAENKSADSVSMAILERLGPIKEKVHTLTYDNGKEFAKHRLIDDVLDSQGYFAHPYSSWERGLNENTNGLIRQYFKKGSCLNHLTESQIAEVEAKLNRRPRKCLDRKTPNSIFFSN